MNTSLTTILIGLALLAIIVAFYALAKTKNSEWGVKATIILAVIDIIVSVTVCIATWSKDDDFKNSIPLNWSQTYTQEYSNEAVIYKVSADKDFVIKLSSNDDNNNADTATLTTALIKIFSEDNKKVPKYTKTVDLSNSDEIYCSVDSAIGDYYIVVEMEDTPSNEDSDQYFTTGFDILVEEAEEIIDADSIDDNPLDYFLIENAQSIPFNEEYQISIGRIYNAVILQLETVNITDNAFKICLGDPSFFSEDNYRYQIYLIQVNGEEKNIISNNEISLVDDGICETDSIRIYEDLPTYLMIYSDDCDEGKILNIYLKQNYLFDNVETEEISIPTTIIGDLYDSADNNKKYYKFNLIDDRYLSIDLTSADEYEHNICVNIYDEYGNDFTNLQIDNNSSIVHIDSFYFPSGTYFIEVFEEYSREISFEININET